MDYTEPDFNPAHPLGTQMRYEQSNGKLHLYFRHHSGRNFVVSEDVAGGDFGAAKIKLVKKMNEINGVTDAVNTDT